MFSRVPNVFKGWKVVRVPPRARRIPRHERFCFDVCTKLAVASSDGLGRGCGLAAAVAYLGVWVAGSVP